jgi:hypothetical protein
MSDTTYDLVKVVNTGDEEIVLRGNTRYVIPVGGERIIPFNEAASWFGDPRLQNQGRDQLRTLVHSQIQGLWGYTEGMTYLRDRWDPTAGFKTWEDFKPSVECFDMDGEPILFVIHDPEGTTPFGGPKLVDPAFQDVGVLNDRIAQNERELAELRQLLTERAHVEAPAPSGPDTSAFDAVNLPQPSADDTVGDDSPRTVSSKNRK